MNDELVQLQNEAVEATIQNESKDELDQILDAPADNEDKIDQLLSALPDDKPAPEDMAAAFIERHLGAAQTLTRELGIKAIKRVFMNVMAGEFSRKEYQPSGKYANLERKLAYHFNECVNLRAKMVFAKEFENLTKAFEAEQRDLAKIEQMTQDQLTPEAKQMLAESGNKVEINLEGENNG